MILALFNGILLGLLLAILIGPVFFSLIETSIRKGISYGIYLAIGIFLSDLFYILITYTGLSKFVDNESFKNILGLSGGFIMIAAGISAILKKQHYEKSTVTLKESKHTDKIKTIIKGFVLNTLNPAVLLFWIGAVSYVSINLKYDIVNAICFFVGTLTITFTSDLGKIYIAQKISSILTDQFILWLNRIAGIGLVLFGLKLFAEVFKIPIW